MVRPGLDGLLLPKVNGIEDVDLISHYVDVLEVANGVSPGHVKLLTVATETPAAMIMTMLEVRLLGTFEIKDKKKLINISSRPAQSLFAYLILSAGTTHRREKLAGMLWPDSLEETARDNLRHALWRIRKALPSQSKVEYILADDLSIAFNSSADYWLDAAEKKPMKAHPLTSYYVSFLHIKESCSPASMTTGWCWSGNACKRPLRPRWRC